jgi:hypothetical protein
VTILIDIYLFINLKTEALLSNENKTISETDNAAAGNTGQKTATNMYPDIPNAWQ